MARNRMAGSTPLQETVASPSTALDRTPWGARTASSSCEVDRDHALRERGLGQMYLDSSTSLSFSVDSQTQTSLPSLAKSSPNKKSKKRPVIDFLVLKEPSATALNDLAKAHRKAPSLDDAITAGASSPRSQRLPSYVPKVNSKWDGLPYSGKRKDSIDLSRLTRRDESDCDSTSVELRQSPHAPMLASRTPSNTPVTRGKESISSPYLEDDFAQIRWEALHDQYSSRLAVTTSPHHLTSRSVDQTSHFRPDIFATSPHPLRSCPVDQSFHFRPEVLAGIAEDTHQSDVPPLSGSVASKNSSDPQTPLTPSTQKPLVSTNMLDVYFTTADDTSHTDALGIAQDDSTAINFSRRRPSLSELPVLHIPARQTQREREYDQQRSAGASPNIPQLPTPNTTLSPTLEPSASARSSLSSRSYSSERSRRRDGFPSSPSLFNRSRSPLGIESDAASIAPSVAPSMMSVQWTLSPRERLGLGSRLRKPESEFPWEESPDSRATAASPLFESAKSPLFENKFTRMSWKLNGKRRGPSVDVGLLRR